MQPSLIGPQLDDVLVRASLLLGSVVVLRAAAVVVSDLLARAPGRLGAGAERLVRGLGPGLLRRTMAVVLGLGVPAATVVAPPSAGAATPSDGRAIETPAGAGALILARSPSPADETMAHVVVRRGDTLWDIARRHLPSGATAAEVARAWPRWYAVNRAAIGPDPALLLPGTRLVPPDRRRTGTSASSHDRPPAPAASLVAVARSLDPDRR